MSEVELPKTGKSVMLSVKCRDCVYFNRGAIYSDKCENLGIQSFASPCEKFTVDPHQINFLESPEIKTLSEIVKTLPDKKLSIIAALLNQESKTRKKGFRLGQKVYIRLFPSDYISNYASAYVVSADKEYVYLQGKKGWRGTMYHNTVLTVDDFKRKRAKLIAKNLIKDPKFASYCSIKLDTKHKLKADDYNIPTIDMYQKYINKKSPIATAFAGKKNSVLRIRG